MSSTDNTDKPTEEVKAQEPQTTTTEGETKPAVTSSSVFSMFGGGAKKEKKDDEDRGDNSGSAKAQRDAAAASKEGEEVRAVSGLYIRGRDQNSHANLVFIFRRHRRTRHQSPRTSISSRLSA